MEILTVRKSEILFVRCVETSIPLTHSQTLPTLESIMKLINEKMISDLEMILLLMILLLDFTKESSMSFC